MKNKLHKKIKINTKVKVGLVILFCSAILFLGFQIFKEASGKKIRQEEQTLFQYTCQPKADYLVHINKNIVYEGDTLGEELVYPKLLLDYIKVKFGTEFQGSEVADLDFDYQVFAIVNGFKQGIESKEIYWSKKYPLTKETTVSISDAYFNEEISVNIELEEYETFASEANKITGMNLSTEIVVYMEGNLNISSSYGELSTLVNSSISAPLLENVFSITKGGVDPINNNITNLIDVPISINQNKIFLYIFLIVAGIIAILITLLITEAPEAYDILILKSKKLLKNYGSRMVALHNNPSHNFKQTYEMNSINDLIKVSDEIQKPIFYLYDEINIIEDFKLHVVDGENLYIYQIF